MMFTVWYLVFMLIHYAYGSQESISINKPIVKSPKQWHFSTDYVRCFCNLPSCVTTGYMCKSSGGGCFSDVLDQSSSYYRGRHGCVEFLIRDPKWKCQTKGGNERTIIKWKDNPKSLLLCCYHDMCNHIENTPLKTIINSTVLSDVTDNIPNSYHQKQETFFSSNSEVWFKAATIAVPICGAVILFVLIALAIKILKTEHQNSAVHKLGSVMYAHHLPQQENKCLKGKHNDMYDDLLRREYDPTHGHIFYSGQQQIEVPLLCKNKQHINAGRKETYAEQNTTESEAETTATVLEIEETVKYPTVDLINVNDSYLSDCDQKKTENIFSC